MKMEFVVYRVVRLLRKRVVIVRWGFRQSTSFRKLCVQQQPRETWPRFACFGALQDGLIVFLKVLCNLAVAEGRE